jgi:hypothetical protein
MSLSTHPHGRWIDKFVPKINIRSFPLLMTCLVVWFFFYYIKSTNTEITLFFSFLFFFFFVLLYNMHIAINAMQSGALSFNNSLCLSHTSALLTYWFMAMRYAISNLKYHKLILFIYVIHVIIKRKWVAVRFLPFFFIFLNGSNSLTS